MVIEDLVLYDFLRRKRNVTRGEESILEMIPRRGLEAMLCTGLSLVRSFELTIEVGTSKYRGKRARWNAVLLIELIKCVMKLWLLIRRGGRRMVLRQGHPDRSTINRIPISPQDIDNDNDTNNNNNVVDDDDDDIGHGSTMIGVGEVLHIVRPIVYLAAIRKWGEDKWKPWLLSLAMDQASVFLSRAGGAGSTRLEKAELDRRAATWIWYALRKPCFGSIKQRLHFLSFLLQVPMLGWVLGMGGDFLETLSTWYFYHAST